MKWLVCVVTVVSMCVAAGAEAGATAAVRRAQFRGLRRGIGFRTIQRTCDAGPLGLGGLGLGCAAAGCGSASLSYGVEAIGECGCGAALGTCGAGLQGVACQQPIVVEQPVIVRRGVAFRGRRRIVRRRRIGIRQRGSAVSNAVGGLLFGLGI